jgi:hypothetical protein
LAAQAAILLGRILLDLDDHPAARLKVADVWAPKLSSVA